MIDPVDRLVREWRQHGKIIIAVDYDDTIFPWKEATTESCNQVIEIIKVAKQTGAYVVIFTACKEDRYVEIAEYCRKHGLEIDAINHNPIDLPYGNDSKVYANIFIDDRAGLTEALTTLNRATYIIRGEQNQKSVMQQQF